MMSNSNMCISLKTAARKMFGGPPPRPRQPLDDSLIGVYFPNAPVRRLTTADKAQTGVSVSALRMTRQAPDCSDEETEFADIASQKTSPKAAWSAVTVLLRLIGRFTGPLSLGTTFSNDLDDLVALLIQADDEEVW